MVQQIFSPTFDGAIAVKAASSSTSLISKIHINFNDHIWGWKSHCRHFWCQYWYVWKYLYSYKYRINFCSFQILLLRMTQDFFLLLTLSLDILHLAHATTCQPDNCPGDFHLEPHQQSNTLSLNHSSTISMKIYKRFSYCCFCCRFDNKWWIWRHNEHWDVPSWGQLHHPSFSSTR